MSEALAGCFRAELALFSCVVALTCEDYNTFYTEGVASPFPCETGHDVYAIACADFFE